MIFPLLIYLIATLHMSLRSLASGGRATNEMQAENLSTRRTTSPNLFRLRLFIARYVHVSAITDRIATLQNTSQKAIFYALYTGDQLA